MHSNASTPVINNFVIRACTVNKHFIGVLNSKRHLIENQSKQCNVTCQMEFGAEHGWAS